MDAELKLELAKIARRFDAMDARFDRMEQRFDNLESQIKPRSGVGRKRPAASREGQMRIRICAVLVVGFAVAPLAAQTQWHVLEATDPIDDSRIVRAIILTPSGD